MSVKNTTFIVNFCEHLTFKKGHTGAYYIRKKISPNVGLEPTTLRLRVWCSTDWASRDLWEGTLVCLNHWDTMKERKKNISGSTEIWTRIAGFRVLSANHYTIEPSDSLRCTTHDNISVTTIYHNICIRNKLHSQGMVDLYHLMITSFYTLNVSNKKEIKKKRLIENKQFKHI